MDLWRHAVSQKNVYTNSTDELRQQQIHPKDGTLREETSICAFTCFLGHWTHLVHLETLETSIQAYTNITLLFNEQPIGKYKAPLHRKKNKEKEGLYLLLSTREKKNMQFVSQICLNSFHLSPARLATHKSPSVLGSSLQEGY